MRTAVILMLLAPALAGAVARVEQRRAGAAVICHRGASEFAHENTLDAYRATFELGGDGNEVDVRRTRDGVLVCFHDDMLDMLLAGAYGDVADHTWAELQQLPFRDPGRMAATCRIPTLEETLALHRTHGGLLVLDVKQPGLDDSIAEMLEKTGMWEHVIGVNRETAPKLANDARIKPRRFKAGLFSDRSDVFADKVAAALKLPGDDLIVDDPRAAIVALGRKLGKPSPRSSPAPARAAAEDPPVAQFVDALRQPAEMNDTERIVARARAADAILQRRVSDPVTLAALTEVARHRTLHKQWIYHGVDGASALRALIVLKSPGSTGLAREIIWGIDPALRAVRDPRWPNPLAWGDWRIKQVAITSLGSWRGDTQAARLCRDYLALSDEQASEIGIPQFEAAARSLLQITRDEATAIELIKHRRQDVRGRAILVCLTHAKENWAGNALRDAAPHALEYVVDE